MVLARRLAAVIVSIVEATSLAGCGGSDEPSGGNSSSAAPAGSSPSVAPAGASPTIEVKQFSFGPMTLAVSPGTTVTWRFDDSAKHNVKASDGSFRSPDLNNGQTFQHTFDKPGTYNYICSIHQYMTARIIVQ